MASGAQINPNTVSGMASQVASFDGSANMRANPATFNASGKGGSVGQSAVGRPSGAGYGSNLAQADGTANLRATTQTYRAAEPITPSGPSGPNIAASNYGNGVQHFPEPGIAKSKGDSYPGAPVVL